MAEIAEKKGGKKSCQTTKKAERQLIIANDILCNFFPKKKSWRESINCLEVFYLVIQLQHGCSLPLGQLTDVCRYATFSICFHCIQLASFRISLLKDPDRYISVVESSVVKSSVVKSSVVKNSDVLLSKDLIEESH